VQRHLRHSEFNHAVNNFTALYDAIFFVCSLPFPVTYLLVYLYTCQQWQITYVVYFKYIILSRLREETKKKLHTKKSNESWHENEILAYRTTLNTYCTPSQIHTEMCLTISDLKQPIFICESSELLVFHSLRVSLQQQWHETEGENLARLQQCKEPWLQTARVRMWIHSFC